MPPTTLAELLRCLPRSLALHAHDLTDGELLDRFLAYRDEPAFTVLVQRHGPMVLGVCRRVLGDFNLAEDSFQATFMVLVRRAASIGRQSALGGWLHAVALRIALKSRAQMAKRRSLERRSREMPRAELLDEVTWQELRGILDEEIGRLPQKYGTPLVLCYLEGKSHDQAARELGWAKTSLTSRLGRGRELLRQQLIRRGINLSAAALAVALGERAVGAPVTALLTLNTVKAAVGIVTGKVVAGCLSKGAIILAEDCVQRSVATKAKLVLLLLAQGTGPCKLPGHGALRPTQLGGCFSSRFAFEVAKHEGCTVLFGQAAQLLVKEGQPVVAGRLVQCRGFGAGRLFGPAMCCGRFRFQGGAPGHAVQPIAHEGPFDEQGSLLDEDDEGGLKSIIGVVDVAEDAATDAHDHGTVALDQCFERRLVAMGKETGEELAVGCGGVIPTGDCLQQGEERAFAGHGTH
jgi:RNA polymerase sigma factor (sigma-70 family)